MSSFPLYKTHTLAKQEHAHTQTHRHTNTQTHRHTHTRIILYIYTYLRATATGSLWKSWPQRNARGAFRPKCEIEPLALSSALGAPGVGVANARHRSVAGALQRHPRTSGGPGDTSPGHGKCFAGSLVVESSVILNVSLE